MSTTASDSVPPEELVPSTLEVLENLHAIFDWGPLSFQYSSIDEQIAEENARVMASNAFYSRHISDQLRVKKIRRCSALSQEMKRVVDERILDGSIPLPSLDTLPKSTRDTLMLSRPSGMRRFNAAVSPYYQYTTVTTELASLFASSMVLTPGFLAWSDFARTVNALRQAVRQKELDYGRPFRTPEAQTASDDLQWREILAAVRLLDPEFPRILVELTDDPRVSTRLGESSFLEFEVIDFDGDIEVFLANQFSDAFPWWGSEPSFVNLIPSEHYLSSSPSPAVGEVQTTVDLWNFLPSSDGLASIRDTKNGPSQTSTSVVDPADGFQQFFQIMWTRAVEHDSTIFVFVIGQTEYIGVRDRSSNTLYISDPIFTVACKDYLKIHVGLHMTILRDLLCRKKNAANLSSQSIATLAMKRARKSEVVTDGDVVRVSAIPPRPYGTKRMRIEDAEKVDIPSAEVSPDNDEPSVDWSEDMKAIALAACEHDHLCLFFHYGVYDSPTSSSFCRVRQNEAGSQMPCVVCPKEADYALNLRERHAPVDHQMSLVITVTCELGSGALGRVHGGYLTIPGTVSHMDVAIKIATNYSSRNALFHEFQVYNFLARQGLTEGFPRVFGLFQDASYACNAVLVMSREGERMPVRVTSQICRSAWTTLKNMHRAGILHGDIRWQNILVGSHGDACIIDFHKSRKLRSTGESHEELAELEEILVQAGAHSNRTKIRPVAPPVDGFVCACDEYCDTRFQDGSDHDLDLDSLPASGTGFSANDSNDTTATSRFTWRRAAGAT